ncbi:hypothetical protein CCAND93_730033 [Capnocytophaga canis]|uniref:Uncharacterized protein n=1 Tax=Capnocytophaga canis TaxID=1848903 RepID=A0A0B7IU84_9FLAO|nr:hypothetical protein CCAND93_730033 [Capnocytophaga canis]
MKRKEAVKKTNFEDLKDIYNQDFINILCLKIFFLTASIFLEH